MSRSTRGTQSDAPKLIRQASCVAIGGRAVMIEGPSAAGKSSLALALIDRGAVLVGDDALALEPDGAGQLIAAPAPNIAGLVEVRGVGLVPMPYCSAPLSLVIVLDEQAPRYLEVAPRIDVAGYEIPQVTLYPRGYALPLRAEQALRIHGLNH